MRNSFSVYQAINAAEGINLLNKKYDISFEKETGIAAANGLEEKDTYVYIKKNNKRR